MDTPHNHRDMEYYWSGITVRKRLDRLAGLESRLAAWRAWADRLLAAYIESDGPGLCEEVGHLLDDRPDRQPCGVEE